jgi:uncharacterized membrane protein YhaH (DUF805 family)
MIEWYKKVVFENYANFNGRARRSEYWYFVLCNFLITLVLYIPLILSISSIENNGEPSPIFYVFTGLLIIYSLAIFIPNLAVIVRRLHDVGKSGWTYLLVLIPLVGPILILINMITEGQPHENKWGKNPKALGDEINDLGKTY